MGNVKSWKVKDESLPVRIVAYGTEGRRFGLHVHCTDNAAARECIEVLRQLDPYCGLNGDGITMSTEISTVRLADFLFEQGLIDDQCKKEMADSSRVKAWRADDGHKNGISKGPHLRRQ